MPPETRMGIEKHTSPKILCIEDYYWSKEVVGRILQMHGYEFIREATGREGIAWAIENHPDIIIVDINLPDIDGYKVANILKNTKETAHIPLIAQSASTEDKEEKTLQAGFDGYLLKPIGEKELLNQINRCLAKGKNK